MADRALLDDLIAKLTEMEEQLSMARLETTTQSLLASRIRQLSVLAIYVRGRLEDMRRSDNPPPKAGDEATSVSPKAPSG